MCFVKFPFFRRFIFAKVFLNRSIKFFTQKKASNFRKFCLTAHIDKFYVQSSVCPLDLPELKSNRVSTIPIHSITALNHFKFCILNVGTTLIKKKIKFSSYIRKFGMEQLQSHIWLMAPHTVYGEIFAHFLIYQEALPYAYDFATAPLWTSLYMRKIWFSFSSVNTLAMFQRIFHLLEQLYFNGKKPCGKS